MIGIGIDIERHNAYPREEWTTECPVCGEETTCDPVEVTNERAPKDEFTKSFYRFDCDNCYCNRAFTNKEVLARSPEWCTITLHFVG